LIGWKKIETDAGCLGEETREQNKVEVTRIAYDIWAREEKMGRMARKKRTGEGILPSIPLNNNHPFTTPTVSLEPMAGSFLMIHAILQLYKACKMTSSTSLASAVAGLSSTPSPPLLC
jgi:hypothetical protein